MVLNQSPFLCFSCLSFQRCQTMHDIIFIKKYKYFQPLSFCSIISDSERRNSLFNRCFVWRTFSEPGLAPCGLAQHRRASYTQNNCLGVAKYCRDLVTACKQTAKQFKSPCRNDLTAQLAAIDLGRALAPIKYGLSR